MQLPGDDLPWEAGSRRAPGPAPAASGQMRALYAHLAYPRLSIPLSKAGTVLGAGGGRAQPLHILPCAPKYRISELDWVVQLHSLQGPVPSRDGLPPEPLHQVLPP